MIFMFKWIFCAACIFPKLLTYDRLEFSVLYTNTQHWTLHKRSLIKKNPNGSYNQLAKLKRTADHSRCKSRRCLDMMWHRFASS